MASGANTTNAADQGRVRRIPVQHRSRERVETILRAADRLVGADGVDALTTSSVAEIASVPVASVYQYFADREAIIAALIERHVVAMDEQLASAVGRLETFSVRTVLQATVDAYVTGYALRPSYVILWFQGRVSAEIRAFVRARSEDLAARFHAFGVAAELVQPATDLVVFRLAAEMVDAFLAVAYRDDVAGDPRLIAEGIEMIATYLERHATPAGITGIPAAALASQLEIGTT